MTLPIEGHDIASFGERVMKHTNPMLHFIAHPTRFPRLRMVAASYMAGHSSNACVEQNFSGCGRNDDPERHLGDETQQDLALVACNREEGLVPQVEGAMKKKREEDQTSPMDKYAAQNPRPLPTASLLDKTVYGMNQKRMRLYVPTSTSLFLRLLLKRARRMLTIMRPPLCIVGGLLVDVDALGRRGRLVDVGDELVDLLADLRPGDVVPADLSLALVVFCGNTRMAHTQVEGVAVTCLGGDSHIPRGVCLLVAVVCNCRADVRDR